MHLKEAALSILLVVSIYCGSTRQDQSADCAMGAQKSADAKARKARTRKAVKEILAAKDLTDPRIDIKPHVTIGIDLGISEDATEPVPETSS